jgi:hypothetical protein
MNFDSKTNTLHMHPNSTGEYRLLFRIEDEDGEYE